MVGRLADDEIVNIQNLQISYMGRTEEHRVVDGLDLGIPRGELLGIAGESGSGKTTLVTGVLRLLRPPGQLRGGHVWFRREPDGQPIDLMALGDEALRQLRWTGFSYVPQGSMNVLNPVATIGNLMADPIRQHGLDRREADRRIKAALQLVNLPPDTIRRYPHELSGGMRQRVVIAGAITMQPPLILADEPTTALDVNVQRQVLQSLVNIRRTLGTTIVLVSHDMAALAQVVDRLAIMYAGQVVETGDVRQVFASPLHPYSKRLISSIPTIGGPHHRIEGIPGLAPSPRAWPAGCRFHPRCPEALPICRERPAATTRHAGSHLVACHLYSASGGDTNATRVTLSEPRVRKLEAEELSISELTAVGSAERRSLDSDQANSSPALIEARNVGKIFTSGGLFSHKETIAVDGVDMMFPSDRPRIVSLVGESGSGKTTLARMILGLSQPTSGSVFYKGQSIAKLSGTSRSSVQKDIQAVFQDPYGIYNPFYQANRVLEMAVRRFGLASSRSEESALIEEALKAVDLRSRDVLGRYPHQLSGGERQRLMLARLFLLKPRLIVADEPVSMIDAAVRAMFLNILLDFRDKLGISTLFITHNLATANYLGGDIVVLYRGRVVERGSIDAIIQSPKHPYTQVLLESVPVADPTHRWKEDAALIGEEVKELPGRARCLFAERCSRVTSACLAARPSEVELADGWRVACVLYS